MFFCVYSGLGNQETNTQPPFTVYNTLTFPFNSIISLLNFQSASVSPSGIPVHLLPAFLSVSLCLFFIPTHLCHAYLCKGSPLITSQVVHCGRVSHLNKEFSILLVYKTTCLWDPFFFLQRAQTLVPAWHLFRFWAPDLWFSYYTQGKPLTNEPFP